MYWAKQDPDYSGDRYCYWEGHQICLTDAARDLGDHNRTEMQVITLIRWTIDYPVAVGTELRVLILLECLRIGVQVLFDPHEVFPYNV